MEFVSYITYKEYLDLGGTVDEDTFNILHREQLITIASC